MLNSVSLEIDALLDNLDQVIDFINVKLEELGCSPKNQIQIDVAVEEMFVNICHYAYEGQSGKALIQIGEYENSEGKAACEISLIDSGIPFDPLAKPDPDVTLPAAERQIGGLGIYMVKKSMDEVTYTRKNDQNIFTMRKYLS